MTHTLQRSLSSLTAIAAASLLLSTPASAHSAQPPDAQTPAATTPDPEIPPPAQPTPAQPEAATPPPPVMTTNPIVQPLPDSSQTPTPAPVMATTPRPAHPATAVSAARPAPPAPAPRPTVTTTPPVAQPSPTLARRDPAGLYTADGTPAAAPAPTPSTQSPYVRYWPLEAGGVIILLGLIGYAFTRRREEDEEEEAFTPTIAPQAGHAPQAEAALPPAITAHNDSPVLTGPVPTGAAREALLKRMVDAPPDAANPFTTRKARMHRARLILQSRKQALRDQAVETFDWRTYRPSLTHPTLGKAKTPKEPAK